MNRQKLMKKIIIAILATTATIKSELYQSRLEKENINCVIPNNIQQRCIMESILGHDSNLLIVMNVQIIPYNSVMHFYGF